MQDSNILEEGNKQISNYSGNRRYYREWLTMFQRHSVGAYKDRGVGYRMSGRDSVVPALEQKHVKILGLTAKNKGR